MRVAEWVKVLHKNWKAPISTPKFSWDAWVGLETQLLGQQLTNAVINIGLVRLSTQ